ncbi:MAG: hypothetical protein PW788_04760 [Micavibrio sp.]|nr:hypothetical protein [Micavibrio sp.]
MKAFVDGYAEDFAGTSKAPVNGGMFTGISRAFNSKIAEDLHVSHLAEDMLQAFYRREHDTVTMLAAQGAKFNPEMLQVAVGFRDHNLAKACLDGGMVPNDSMVRYAIDARDAPFADMLMRHMPVTPELRDYAQRNGTEEIRHSVEAYRR